MVTSELYPRLVSEYSTRLLRIRKTWTVGGEEEVRLTMDQARDVISDLERELAKGDGRQA